MLVLRLHTQTVALRVVFVELPVTLSSTMESTVTSLEKAVKKVLPVSTSPTKKAHAPSALENVSPANKDSVTAEVVLPLQVVVVSASHKPSEKSTSVANALVLAERMASMTVWRRAKTANRSSVPSPPSQAPNEPARFCVTLLTGFKTTLDVKHKDSTTTSASPQMKEIPKKVLASKNVSSSTSSVVKQALANLASAKKPA